jgi:hypothetical protein
MMRWSTLVLAACALVVSLSAKSGTTRSTSALPVPTASKEIDFGAIVRRAHFAFREDDTGAYAFGDRGYSSRVSKAGVVSVASAGSAARAIQFETKSITRGGVATSHASIEERQDVETGGVSITRSDDVVEHVVNTKRGVEQSWSIAKPIDGKGDLVVVVDAPNARYKGSDARGLHFEIGDGVDSFTAVYGNATWVDHAGATHAIMPTYKNGAIAMRVSASVVDHAAYPAVLDPVIGTEFDLDASTDAPIAGATPHAAFDGTNYLAVWTDSRGSTTAIYGARISPQTGKPIASDVTGHLIGDSIGAQTYPAILFDGTNYFVAWLEVRNAVTSIYSARVSGKFVCAAGRVRRGELFRRME